MKKARQLEVIECRGTPYEIGQQWGEACRDSILQGLENCLMGMNLVYNASREEVISRAMRFLPLALGSYWGVIPGHLVIRWTVLRIKNEEELLLRELPGYLDYSQRRPAV